MPARGPSGLRFNITANNLAKKTLLGLGSTAKNVAKGIGVAFAAAAAATTAAFVKIAVSVEQMKSQIVRDTGASGAALDGLMKTALAVSGQVTQGMDAVGVAVGAINTHYKATGETLENLTKRSLDFARVTGTDVSTTVDSLARATAGWELTADQSAASLDTLIGVTQDYGIAGGKLLDQVQSFGPLFANADLSFEQTAITMGRLYAAGQDITRVGPGLNKMLRDAAAEGKTGAQAFSEMETAIRGASTDMEALAVAQELVGAEGAQRLSRAIRQGGVSLSFAADDAASYTGALDDAAKASLTLRDRFDLIKNSVVSAIGEAILPHLDKFSEWWDSGGGETMQRWATTIGGVLVDLVTLNWQGAWDKLWTGTTTTKVDALADALGDVSDEFKTLTTGITDERVQKFQDALDEFLADPTEASAQKLRTAMLAIAPWLELNMPTIGEKIEAILGSDDWRDPWDNLTDPLTKLDALYAGLKDIGTETLKSITEGINDERIQELTAAMDAFLADPTEASAQRLRCAMLAVGPWLELNIPLLGDKVEEILGSDDWRDPWTGLSDPVNEQKGVMQEAFDEIEKFLKQELPGLAKIIEDAANGEWATAWKYLGTLAIQAVVGLAGLLSSAVTRVLNGVLAAAEKFLGLFVGPVNWVRDKIPGMDPIEAPTIGRLPTWGYDEILDVAGSYDPFGFKGDVGDAQQRWSTGGGAGGGGGGPQGPSIYGPGVFANPNPVEHKTPGTGHGSRTIPRMAAGGLVTEPTLAMIGEEGPEAVVPLDQAGGMGTTINVYVQGSIYGPEDFIAVLRDRARVTGGLELGAIL